MPESLFEGPVVSAGALLNGPNAGTTAPINPMDGPSLDYQGVGFLDPRFAPINKDGLSPGRIPMYFNSPSAVLVDAIPSATATANIAADQAPSTTAGVALALATSSNATTADVRGTINASTLAVATVASTNGARRLTVIMNVPINNMLNATPNATAQLFGAAQA